MIQSNTSHLLECSPPQQELTVAGCIKIESVRKRKMLGTRGRDGEEECKIIGKEVRFPQDITGRRRFIDALCCNTLLSKLQYYLVRFVISNYGVQGSHFFNKHG